MSKRTILWIFLAVALLGINDVRVAGKVVSAIKYTDTSKLERRLKKSKKELSVESTPSPTTPHAQTDAQFTWDPSQTNQSASSESQTTANLSTNITSAPTKAHTLPPLDWGDSPSPKSSKSSKKSSTQATLAPTKQQTSAPLSEQVSQASGNSSLMTPAPTQQSQTLDTTSGGNDSKSSKASKKSKSSKSQKSTKKSGSSQKSESAKESESKSTKSPKSSKSAKKSESKSTKSPKSSKSAKKSGSEGSKSSKSSKKSSKSSKQSKKSGSKSYHSETPTVAPSEPSDENDVMISTAPSVRPSKNPTTMPSISRPVAQEVSTEDLEVCTCDESNVCTDGPLPRGSNLRLCFLMASTTSIDLVENLYLDQAGLVTLDIVMAGLQVHDEAEIACDESGQNCIVTTPILEAFFAEKDPPDVLAKGSAMISSSAESSTSMRRETRRLEQLKVDFSATIKLEKPKSQDNVNGNVQSSNQSSNLGAAKSIGAAMGAVALVTTLALGATLYRRRMQSNTMAEV